MRGRWATRLAWGVWSLIVGLLAVTLLPTAVDPALHAAEQIPVLLTLAVMVCAFASVGALLASRRPSNPIGWLCLVTAFAFGLAAAMFVYTELEIDGVPLPGAAYAAWLATLGWLVGFIVPGSFILLLFPTGRLPSRRWRWVRTLAFGGLTFGFIRLLSPGPLEGVRRPLENPFGVSLIEPAVPPIGTVGDIATFLAILGSIGSLFVRFARGKGDERQQVKWLFYAGSLVPVALLAEAVLRRLYGAAQLTHSMSNVFMTVALATVPVAIAVAILRYRLYDIDVIINRTLVYGALTAFLGLSYYGLIIVLQQLFSDQIAESQLAVAGSTLAVAALFRPARARIQGFIDRRFYRARYDAARTLETFSQRLRDEIDLDALQAELFGVLKDTVQPAHASLWLRSRSGGGMP